MGTRIQDAEGMARPALARMAQAIESGNPFAFQPVECRAIVNLIDALRDNQAIDMRGNPYEKPCPVCHGDTDEDDPCEACDGLGIVPTKNGQAIMDMVIRHLSVEGDESDIFVADPPEGIDP